VYFVALLRVLLKIITFPLSRPKKTRALVKEEEEEPLLVNPQPPGSPEVNKVKAKVS